MLTTTAITWSGGLPGYGAINASGFWAVSLPDRSEMRLSTGETIALPEPANAVQVSAGGQWAWQGNHTGLIYRGTASTGQIGYGQHAFLFVGEDLRIFTDAQTYQATSGGWAYVNEAGSIVTWGAAYSNPPLANTVQFHDIWIGQGQTGGLCCFVPGDVGPRLVRAGNADFFSVARSGDTFRLLVVDDGAHTTTILDPLTLAQLRACPLVALPVPIPVPAPVPTPTPAPEPPPMTYDANTPSTWTDTQLAAWVAQQLAAARSTDDPAYWVTTIRAHTSGADASYWAGRIATGDGAGKAPGPTPAPTPSPAPVPFDPSGLQAQIAALAARVEAIEARPTPAAPDLSPYARYGDAIVSGSVSTYGLKSNTVTWTVTKRP